MNERNAYIFKCCGPKGKCQNKQLTINAQRVCSTYNINKCRAQKDDFFTQRSGWRVWKRTIESMHSIELPSSSTARWFGILTKQTRLLPRTIAHIRTTWMTPRKFPCIFRSVYVNFMYLFICFALFERNGAISVCIYYGLWGDVWQQNAKFSLAQTNIRQVTNNIKA